MNVREVGTQHSKIAQIANVVLSGSEESKTNGSLHFPNFQANACNCFPELPLSPTFFPPFQLCHLTLLLIIIIIIIIVVILS